MRFTQFIPRRMPSSMYRGTNKQQRYHYYYHYIVIDNRSLTGCLAAAAATAAALIPALGYILPAWFPASFRVQRICYDRRLKTRTRNFSVGTRHVTRRGTLYSGRVLRGGNNNNNNKRQQQQQPITEANDDFRGRRAGVRVTRNARRVTRPLRRQ